MYLQSQYTENCQNIMDYNQRQQRNFCSGQDNQISIGVARHYEIGFPSNNMQIPGNNLSLGTNNSEYIS